MCRLRLTCVCEKEESKDSVAVVSIFCCSAYSGGKTAQNGSCMGGKFDSTMPKRAIFKHSLGTAMLQSRRWP
jgi:hypothetical protein